MSPTSLLMSSPMASKAGFKSPGRSEKSMSSNFFPAIAIESAIWPRASSRGPCTETKDWETADENISGNTLLNLAKKPLLTPLISSSETPWLLSKGLILESKLSTREANSLMLKVPPARASFQTLSFQSPAIWDWKTNLSLYIFKFSVSLISSSSFLVSLIIAFSFEASELTIFSAAESKISPVPSKLLLIWSTDKSAPEAGPPIAAKACLRAFPLALVSLRVCCCCAGLRVTVPCPMSIAFSLPRILLLAFSKPFVPDLKASRLLFVLSMIAFALRDWSILYFSTSTYWLTISIIAFCAFMREA